MRRTRQRGTSQQERCDSIDALMDRALALVDWDPGRSVELTSRERQVLTGAAHGETVVETGRRIHLSEGTVKWYRERLRAKLDAKNMAHAVAVAFRQGLLELA